MSTRCCGFASFALLCLLAVICFQGVCGEDISGPSVTECRPHIERALKEQLQHAGSTSEHSGSVEDTVTVSGEEHDAKTLPTDETSAETLIHSEEIASAEDAATVEAEGDDSNEQAAVVSTEDKSGSAEHAPDTSAEETVDKSNEDSGTTEQADEQSGEESDNKSGEDVVDNKTDEDTGEKSEEDTKTEDDAKSAEEGDSKSTEDVTQSGENVDDVSGEKSDEADGKSQEAGVKSDETDDNKSDEESGVKQDSKSEEVEDKSEENADKSTANIDEQDTDENKSEEDGESEKSKEHAGDDSDTGSAEQEAMEEAQVREERSIDSSEKQAESLEVQAESGEQDSVPGSHETQESVETDAEPSSVESKEEKSESAEVQQVDNSQSEEQTREQHQDEGSQEQADKSDEQESSETQDAPEDTTTEFAESTETIEKIVEPLSDEPDDKSAEKSEEKAESGEQGDQTSDENKSDEEAEGVKKSSDEDKYAEDETETVSVEKQESKETGTKEVEDDTVEKSEEAEDKGKSDETDTAADEGEPSSETDAESEASAESNPEDELTKEFLVPENLRNRDHLDQLLGLSDELTESDISIAKAVDVTLRELKRLYDAAIKPLEIVYKYRELSNRHFGDPEIFSKPLILFMGPWSGGKSSIINYLTNNEYNETSLRTGAEPSPAYFNILMWGSEPEILDGTQLAADWTFSGLQKFGQGLEDRLRGLKLPNNLLEKVNIVEIPGILEVRKQVSRVFPFNDACQWFIDRADIIFLVYDPSKLDVGPETEAILDQLKGREYQTRIVLNKADTVKPEELMRVQGALIWNISPLMSSPQPPVMYTTSLWSNPFTSGAPERLLMAQERAFLRDLRQAIEKRVENKISSARRFAVRVRNHAKMVDCYLTTYYNHKTLFGNRKQTADAIIEHPQEYHIYEGLSTLTNISRYDLPDPDVYRDFFKLNPLYEFQQLSATCTYFRGCPINRLDVAIAYDLPELVGRYKKMVEQALPSNKPNNS